MIRIDTDDLIEFLNSLVKLDPVAIGKLVEARVPCNEELAQHPTVQVSGHGEGEYSSIPEGEYRVGILGILNGYAGTIEEGPRKGWGSIAAVIEDDGHVSKFIRTDRMENSPA